MASPADEGQVADPRSPAAQAFASALAYRLAREADYGTVEALPWPAHALLRDTVWPHVMQRVMQPGNEPWGPAVDHLVAKSFGRAEARRLDEDWQRTVPHRAALLAQALGAHNFGLYGVTVPAVLCHLLGAISDNFVGGQPPGKPREEALHAAGVRLLETGSMAHLARILAWMAPSAHRSSRKGLLAGRSVHYATEANSLRLILAVDTVVSSSGSLLIRADNGSHCAGCPTLDPLVPDYDIVPAPDLAAATCPECRPLRNLGAGRPLDNFGPAARRGT